MTTFRPTIPPTIGPTIDPYASGDALHRDGSGAIYDPSHEGSSLARFWAGPSGEKAAYGITEAGTGVSSWVDRVAAYDAANATDAQRPSYLSAWTQGKAAVDFNGTSDRLLFTVGADALLASTTDFTVCLWGELDALTGGADNWILDFSNGYMAVILETDTAKAGWYDSAYRSTAAPSTGVHFWCWVCDSAVVGGSTVYQDGVALGTATVTNNGLGGTVAIGAEGTPSAHFNGKIGRLEIFGKAFDASAVARARGWGQNYYGAP